MTAETPAGGGFRVRPDEVPGLLRQWEDALARAIGQRDRIDTIRGATRPSDDPASTLSNAAIRATGEKLWRQNEANIAYARDWVARLRDAQRDYQQVEHANADLFRHAENGSRGRR
ncbi:MAG TPA: hypothetical protein VHF06_31425 [Pseudonocardiaceae bacterium]|nr:hypothetical protein [Pseudonocardiaceae bacterium]